MRESMYSRNAGLRRAVLEITLVSQIMSPAGERPTEKREHGADRFVFFGPSGMAGFATGDRDEILGRGFGNHPREEDGPVSNLDPFRTSNMSLAIAPPCAGMAVTVANQLTLRQSC